MFHDIGLTHGYRPSQLRFEVDGANAARDFLRGHGIPEGDVEKVWMAVALHTTPGFPTVHAGRNRRSTFIHPFPGETIMTFDIANWMSLVDGAKSLSALSIPASHDSAARFGDDPRLVTQSRPLDQQLEGGILFLDIRAKLQNGVFNIFHEDTFEQINFGEVQDICLRFLAAHSRETIILSLKREEGSDDDNNPFEDRFDQYVALHPSLWYLQSAIPTLGQVRGKIVLFRRFHARTLPKGIPAASPDYKGDPTFTIDGPPKLKVQDHFYVTVGENDRKYNEVKDFLDKAAKVPTEDGATLFVNFSSGAALANTPRIVADSVNPKLVTYFKDHPQGRFGIVIRDFEGILYEGTDINVSIARTNVLSTSQSARAGYWIASSNGGVSPRGSAVTYPPVNGTADAAVAIAATPTGSGYWILTGDGKVYGYGQAPNLGSPDRKAVSIAAKPTSGGGLGYWVLSKNGHVIAYNAPYHGQLAPSRQVPLQIVPTPDAGGYWILTDNGRVHTYGNATPLPDRRNARQESVAMAATRDGRGYWILSSNGAVHEFGNAVHHGQKVKTNTTARMIVATHDGGGYWVLYANGDVQRFGTSIDLGGAITGTPAVGIATDPHYFFLKSKLNGEVVDVRDASPAAGTPLVGYPQKTSDTDNQLWMLAPSGTPSYFFIASKQTGEVIDIQFERRAPGTPLIAFPQKKTGTDNQLWSLVPSDGTGRYVFITSKLTNEVIDIRSAQTAPRTPLVAFPRKTSDTDNQLWSVVRSF